MECDAAFEDRDKERAINARFVRQGKEIITSTFLLL